MLSHTPVGPLILQKLTVSGPLALLAAAIALAVSVPTGVVAGVRYRRLSGAVLSALSLGGIAIPAFWAGLLLATVFAVKLRLFPAGGFIDWTEDPVAAARSLVLPAVALGLVLRRPCPQGQGRAGQGLQSQGLACARPPFDQIGRTQLFTLT